MPWANRPADRARSAATYDTPEYRRNRDAARRRAGGRCEQCLHAHGRLECDHVVNAASGGTHDLGNLRMLCKGPGTCKCHEAKTAREGGGWRRRQDPPPQERTVW